MPPSLKLTYFDAVGYAESIRLTLTIGGLPFSDERLSPDQFASARAGGQFPFLSVPVLSVDGETFAESNALLRYAGKLAGLYPSDDGLAAMRVDMASDGVDTLIRNIFMHEAKEEREKAVAESFPRYMGAVERMYAKTEGAFLLGETMSVVDVKLHIVVTMLSTGKVPHVPADVFEKFPLVRAMAEAVGAHEKVKAWKAAH